MSAFPQEFQPQGNNSALNQFNQLLSQVFDDEGQILGDAWKMLFGQEPKVAQTIENLVLNLVYDSYVSLDATCVALAINDAMLKLDTSRSIVVHDLQVRQVADAREACTASTYYPARNANIAAMFSKLAQALVKAGNIPVDPGNTDETNLISILESISDTLREGMFQECVASAYNSAAVRDIGSRNAIKVTGRGIFQSAEADVRNCLNTMVAGKDGGSTVKGLAAEFAKAAAARSNPPPTYEAALIDCATHYYWTILAIGAFILFLILLGLRYVAHKYI